MVSWARANRAAWDSGESFGQTEGTGGREFEGAAEPAPILVCSFVRLSRPFPARRTENAVCVQLEQITKSRVVRGHEATDVAAAPASQTAATQDRGYCTGPEAECPAEAGITASDFRKHRTGLWSCSVCDLDHCLMA